MTATSAVLVCCGRLGGFMLELFASVRRFRRLGLLVGGCLGTVLSAAPVEAQDFWLVPDSFAFGSGATVVVTGFSGVPFLKRTTSPGPAAVADARLIGASGEKRLLVSSSKGRNLRLRRKPGAPSQYIVAVSLKPRTARTTQTGFLRYLREQGAVEEASRLSGETAFKPDDMVTYRLQRFATVIVDVGSGPKVYARGAGYPIDFIPQSDPVGWIADDTVAIRLVLDGHPLPGLGVQVTVAPRARKTSGCNGKVSTSFRLRSDPDGVVRVPVTEPGIWMLSTARVVLLASPGGPEPGFWDVSWATYVFYVRCPREGRERSVTFSPKIDGGPRHHAAGSEAYSLSVHFARLVSELPTHGGIVQ